MSTKTNWTNRNIPAGEKKQIITSLEASIKKFGLQKVRAVTTHYFKTYIQKTKAQKRIDELKAEIADLEKKK